MKKINFTLIMIFSFNLLFAQKESNVWCFGNNAGLDFNSGAPVDILNNVMYSIEGCTSISDSNGNLLFYSNGEKVWDKNHVVMPNGDSLGGHQSATQAALIVPYPNNPGMYFLFTLQQQHSPPITNFNFSYSIVDMSLNSGNGDVTVKNTLIKAPISEKIAGVKHANGNDIWVMVHGYGNDSLFAYLLTSIGVSTTPVISKIGVPLNGINSLGYMKFSADGSKLAYACRWDNYVELFDFDNSTGVVSNEKYLTLPPPVFYPNFGAYGLEFSLSGNYLYATGMRHNFIYQWDITSNSDSIISSTLQSLGFVQGTDLGALQMAPNGKIYLVKAFQNLLGVINNPELPGILANYVDSGVVLSHLNNFGLPNFIATNYLTVGMEKNELQNQISVFPNPSVGNFIVSFENTIVKGKIEILSTLGQNIFIQNIRSESKKEINLVNLSEGIYFVKVIDGEKIYSKKLIINRN